MGFMDDMSKRISAFQADVEKSIMGSKKKCGHVLGSKSDNSATASGSGHKLSESTTEPKAQSTIVRVRFTEAGTLGMTVSRGEKNLPQVTTVHREGVAEKAGICKGDIVTTLNGEEIDTFKKCMDILKKGERPLEIVFSRALSEKEARRVAQAKAALERDGAWNRRVASRPQGGKLANTRNPVSSTEEANLSNPETRAAWEAAAQRHAEQTRELGYDPYKPLLTGTSASSQSASRPPPQKKDEGTRLGGNDESKDYDTASTEVQVALQALASSDKGTEAQEACVATLLKLLDNVLNKTDEKFRRVRLANANIQAKILEIEGGLEILIAAGFQLQPDGDETILQLPNNFSRPRCQASYDALSELKSQFASSSS
uniref:PDZ domain-containing protein n=1 Tax=Aureoumbra lagunensis TaxID=44058 RepID=A0A7S3JPU7_9STRA|mmetsp:Transcript_23748/g.30898  ORF Transcript_23748/g.30898 Transcript_23748/m.30898 type:complete len:372 (+) Transcript_23748:223-1338(+)|eukprot:CAMPEP_0197288284 /NCGR_PEP_ID=MMETSP0890-20130614/5294_1 /TAXON_ID=44058 ORGANISM="Aureoumbra lagunensis, Strain CCMP1510" /NCGR_SAMPLE_ID=MMETSP0890 /ASSEMBLY_ACC=CAM_ASM_000533 /LENGTH=371 /DNA_ID=CAMNT_0042758871 /DNA_START=152 /DNA_END=1267 /DNA_ORIENTATION=+